MLAKTLFRLRRTVWPGTIGTRLFFMVALAALLLVGVRLLHLRHESQHKLGIARAQAVELAKSGVNSGLDVIDEARMSLEILSQVPALVQGSGPDCSTLLENVQRSRPWAAGLFVLDVSRTVVCSSTPDNLGLNIADRPYVQQAVASNRFVAGDFIIGRKSNVPMIGSAMPVRNQDGSLQRVFVATISTTWFNRTAAELASASPGSSVTLIDGSGVVLAHAPGPEEKIGGLLASDSMRAGLLNMAAANFDAVGSDGRERIFGAASLPHSNALLLIGLSREAAQADLVRNRQQALLELALLCLVMGATMWAFGSVTLDKPIRAVLDHARDVGQGHLHSRLQSRNWPRELALLGQTMNLMAGRLERRNAQLQAAQKKLRRQASTDPLTGLANRRAFDETLAGLWREAHAAGTPLSVAIVDADYFKRYNDTYGHMAGDTILQILGHIFAEEAANTPGFAARLGGEEFALVLPGLDEGGALGVADRVCAAVRDLAIAHEGATRGHVTVSIGVAGLVPRTAEVDQLLLRSADAALYAAKSLGRDQALGNSRLGRMAPEQGKAEWLQRA